MSLRELLARAAGALGLGWREAELGRELRFHLEMLEERHRAGGLDAAAARRAARLELGGDAQIAEAWRDQRSLPFVETLAQDVRYGFRMLRRTPGFTVAALVTLALGIGANTAIFSVVDAVLLRPLPYFEPERLVTIGDRNPAGFSSNVGFATVLDWRERSRSFEQLAMMRSWGPTLVTNGEAAQMPAVRVSGNYFEMMGIHPALGRGFTADDDRPDHWRVLDSYLVAVVKAGAGAVAALAPSARAVLRDLDPSVPVYQVATLSALIDKSAAERRFVMRLLAGFALVAVLLAAIGLHGVVSCGVTQRTREVGVRVALGAQRRDVLRLVLSSGLSLVGIGVAVGLVAACLVTRFLGTLVFGVSPVDPPTFAAAAALLTVVALGAHWVPIRRALRIDPASALRAE